MKLLIASDLHGSAPSARRLHELINEHQPDKIVLLGDLLYHGPRNDLPEGYAPKEVFPILNGFAADIIAVRGNCDSEVDQMVLTFPMMADSTQLFIDGLRIFVTHGHLFSEEAPPPLNKGDILLSGHTHIGRAEAKNGVVYLNPGSISIPKDEEKSYMVYEDGVFTRLSLDGRELLRWPQS